VIPTITTTTLHALTAPLAPVLIPGPRLPWHAALAFLVAMPLLMVLGAQIVLPALSSFSPAHNRKAAASPATLGPIP